MSAGLEALVAELMEQPDAWEHLVAHDPGQRRYELLRRDDEVEVWLICWMHDHDTGFHDHDVSSGAVAVISGSVREDRLVLGSAPSSRVVPAGGAFSFKASDIHRVQHVGAEPAVTLHAYSPPLWRMGTYEVQPGGRLLRHSVSYAEELRPLNFAA